MSADERDVSFLLKEARFARIEKKEEDVFHHLLALGVVHGKDGYGVYKKWLIGLDKYKRILAGEDPDAWTKEKEEARKKYSKDMRDIYKAEKKLNAVLKKNKEKKEAARKVKKAERIRKQRINKQR